MRRPSAEDPLLKSELVGAFGTIVEWYDFSLYVYFAPVYARIFFGNDGADGLVATFAVFGAAYLARPLGAAVFGSYGDRHGRKRTLTVTATIMTGALLANAALPTEAAIGSTAAILLIAVRFVMGFALGGEYSGILVYLAEVATPERRGFVGSWSLTAAYAGVLLAVGVSAVLTTVLSEAALDAWGWRVPLVIGAVLALMVLALRRSLVESETFERLAATSEVSRSPVRDVLRSAPGPVFVVFSMAFVAAIAMYLNLSFVPTFLQTYEDVSAATALRWSALATAATVGGTLFFGWLSDIIGRRWAFGGASAFLALATVPLFAMLDGAVPVAITAMVALGLGVSAFTGALGAALSEQLPGRLRVSGLAIGYNLAMLVGGFVPLLATLLIESSGSTLAPAVVASVVGVYGVVVGWRITETARLPLRD
ncbi:MAG: MFS transporter [Actinomycetota bacterium]